MICNAGEEASRIALLRETAQFARVLDAAERSGIPLLLVPAPRHLELAGTTAVNGRANRALLKVFRAGGDLWAAFFYKRSQIPHSRDRYAYGVVEFPEGGPAQGVPETWFRWVDVGFHPEHHPPALKRAFTYTVPEE